MTWPRLGAIEVDLVDEDDRRRRLGRLLEHLAQPLLGLAIGRAHDLRPGDVEELGVALIGDGARQPGLAGAGRTVEQHALGRVDAEALEQLGMAQRQLDHLAQRVDRVVHPAEVVIGDVGAPLAVLLLGKFGQQFDLGVGVDVDDALGRGRDDGQPHFLQREGGGVEQLPDMLGHVGVDPLVAGGRDRVALGQNGRPAKLRFSASAEPCRRTLFCAGAKTTWVAGLRDRLVDLDEIARADAGIGALQAVEADDVEPCVLAIGADGAGGGRALADDLDHVAFGQAQLLHQLDRQAGDPAAAVGRRQVGDLHAPDQSIDCRHSIPLHVAGNRPPKTPPRNGGGAMRFNLGAERAEKKAGRCRPA